MREPLSRTEDPTILRDRLVELENEFAALKKENDRLMLVTQGSREGLWDWPDLNEDLQWWSPGFFKLLGYENIAFQPTLGRFAELLHPQDRQAQIAAVEDLLERDEPFESEYRIRHRSGHYLWFRARGQVFHDEQGAPVRMAGSVQDITDQKHAESALRESEQRYRMVVETATDAIFVADADTGELLDANRRAEELLGRPRDEFIGRHQSIVHPADEETYSREQFGRAVKEQGRIISDIRVQHRDGRVIPVEISSGGAIELDGRRVHIGIFRDVTTRRKAEQALRESEARFRTLFEQAPISMGVARLDGTILAANAAARALFGFEPEENFDRPVQDYYVDPAERRTVLEAFHTHGLVRDRELLLRRPDGREIRVNLTMVPFTWSGEPAVLSSMEDITERWKAEDALRASEAILNETGMIARIGGWEHDLETRQAVWTRALREILEFEQEPLPGPEEHLDYYPPEDRVLLERSYERARTTGEPFDLQLRCRTPRGHQLRARVMGRPIFRDGRCVRMVGTFQDITALRQAEERSREVEEQLRQAQKMEAVGTLAAGVAHDFNNALTAIQGYADKAALTVPDDHPVSRDLQGVMAAAEQAAKVTRSLLTFSRKAPSQMAPVNLAQLVEDSTHLLSRVLPAAVAMEVDIDDPERAWIHADAVQLSQVLMNLVVNARDAMPDGGRLQLLVTTRTEMAATHEAADSPASTDTVLLQVTDEGCGMAADVLRRVCDPFFTTKDRGQGTGLGMSVVHGIVNAHQATMHITSEKGRGTRVRIAFPRREPADEEVVEERSAETPAREGGRILVAEDNEAVRSVMTEALAVAGYTVIEAADGAEALQRFEEHGLGLDMAILDVDMPRLGGKACLARMQEQRPGFPVILVSGFYESGADAGVVQTDHVAFLPKPFTLSDLRRKVNDLLARASGA